MPYGGAQALADPAGKEIAGYRIGRGGVLAKALAKSPDDRYESCLAFVTALRTATPAETPAVTSADTAGERRPVTRPPPWAEPVLRDRKT